MISQTAASNYFLGPTFINACIVNLLQTWLIETDCSMGVMTYLGQEGLHSQSALSSLSLSIYISI